MAMERTPARSTYMMTLLGLLATLLVLTVYLSLRSSSHMTELGWMPGWLAQWADRNGDARTAVPYFLLALLWARIPVEIEGGRRTFLLSGIMLMWILLAATEGLQYFLPRRTPSWPDMGWGTAGILTGIVLGCVLLKWTHRPQAALAER